MSAAEFLERLYIEFKCMIPYIEAQRETFSTIDLEK